MRTIVATATTDQEATEIYLSIVANQPYIEFAQITGLQVTVIYTPVAEREAQQEEQPQPEVTTKKRKQPKAKELNAKAEKLCLFDIEVDKNGGVYEIRKIYGGAVLFMSKSGISVSRRLTKMHWDNQITRLQADGLIAS
jgi:cytoskeletal protein RodZ